MGSTFTLYLPLTYVGAATPARTGAPGAQPTAAPALLIDQVPDDRHALQPEDSVLLIVEDDPHYARVMVDLAHDNGFKVLVAMRGADALALAREFRPSARADASTRWPSCSSRRSWTPSAT